MVTLGPVGRPCRVTRTQAWILAIRPRTLSAGAAPVVAASGLAAADGVFAQLPAVAALAGALLIQIATNLANDYYDFVKGGDTGERLGPVQGDPGGDPAARCGVRGDGGDARRWRPWSGVYLAWVGGLAGSSRSASCRC